MRRFGPPLILLTLLSVATFFPALGGEFLRWDDREHLELNPFVTEGRFTDIWSRPYFGLFVPVTYSLWSLIFKASPSPVAFHLFNLLLHIGCGFLVYLLLLAYGSTRALLAACFFLVHPLQVESVAWISGARDLLAGFFGLLTLYWLSLRRSLVTYVLGLLSKPTLLALPLASSVFKPERWRKLLVLVGMGLALGVYTFWIQSEDLAAKPDIAIWWRPLIALDALGFYVAKLFLPYPLSADYGRSPLFVLENFSLFYVAVLLFAASLLWHAPSEVRKGFAFAFLMLLPVLGLVPFQAQAQSTVADRYVYLSLFGVAIAVAHLASTRKRRHVIIGVVAILAGLSFYRARAWSTNYGFFTAMNEENPRSYAAATTLGVLEMFNHRDAVAEAHLRRALTLTPENVEAAANLASLLWVSGRGALILQDLEPLLRDPDYVTKNRSASRALSVLYRLVARAEDTQGLRDKALSDYCTYAAMDPSNAEGSAEVQHFLAKWQASCN